MPWHMGGNYNMQLIEDNPPFPDPKGPAESLRAYKLCFTLLPIREGGMVLHTYELFKETDDVRAREVARKWIAAKKKLHAMKYADVLLDKLLVLLKKEVPKEVTEEVEVHLAPKAIKPKKAKEAKEAQ